VTGVAAVDLPPHRSADGQLVPDDAFRRIEAFLFREARLLDERRYLEWERLWTDDAIYWVPSEYDDYDPTTRVSLIYDDRGTLAKRIARLTGPDSHAEQPPAHVRRLVSNVEVTRHDAEVVVVESNFIAVCARGDVQETWAGRSTHHLLPVGDGDFAIESKKVVLVNCMSVLPHLPFLP
jgi:benzoate/toluate 1,2-dioxygenase subunit beta